MGWEDEERRWRECAGEGRSEVKGQVITVNGEVEGVMRRGTGVRGEGIRVGRREEKKVRLEFDFFLYFLLFLLLLFLVLLSISSRESAVGRNGVEREGKKKETRSRSGHSIGEARRVKEKEDFNFRGPLRACQALISVDSFDSRFISVRVRV